MRLLAGQNFLVAYRRSHEVIDSSMRADADVAFKNIRHLSKGMNFPIVSAQCFQLSQQYVRGFLEGVSRLKDVLFTGHSSPKRLVINQQDRDIRRQQGSSYYYCSAIPIVMSMLSVGVYDVKD